MIERFDLVQIPVLPLVDQQSRWISGHYCDEFAEAHGTYLAVREAIGAAVPAAGVGCAFSRAALERGGPGHGGWHSAPGFITEDYEEGLPSGSPGGAGLCLQLRRGAASSVRHRSYFYPQ